MLAAMPRWTVSLLAALACLDGVHGAAAPPKPPPAPPFQAAAIEIPFEMTGGRPYVQAYVNGRGPYRMLFDNGASGMGRADIRLVETLGLPVSGTAQNSDGVNTATVDVVRVDSVRLGALTRTGLELLARDYNRTSAPDNAISGIIGRDFFADGLLTIDYPARRLVFDPSRRLEPGPGVLTYTTPFRVPVRLGDDEVEGVLDTGSNLTMHLPRALYLRLVADPLEPAGQGRRANTVFQLYRTRIREAVRVGAVEVSGLDVMVSDTAPWLNIGAGFLQHYVLAIDQRSRRIALTRPDGAAK